MDAGLAKVLNSTVGTSDFKSLDEVLNSSKSIVASDEEYERFSDEFSRVPGGHGREEKSICSITLPLDGSANIIYKIGFSEEQDDYYALFYIYKNGVKYLEVNAGGDSVNTQPQRIAFIEGKRGDVFEIRTTSTTTRYAPLLYLYSINATVKASKSMSITSLL